jgi:hypothetical protein
MSLTTLSNLGIDNTALFQLTPIPEYLPVLQQPKAQMTTNIPQMEVKRIELVKEEPSKGDRIGDMKIKDIMIKMSESFDGITNDLYNKPEDATLVTYIVEICQKDNRYFYIGLLLFIIVFVLLIFK